MSDFIVEKLSKSVGDKTVFKDISFINCVGGNSNCYK